MATTVENISSSSTVGRAVIGCRRIATNEAAALAAETAVGCITAVSESAAAFVVNTPLTSFIAVGKLDLSVQNLEQAAPCPQIQ